MKSSHSHEENLSHERSHERRWSDLAIRAGRERLASARSRGVHVEEVHAILEEISRELREARMYERYALRDMEIPPLRRLVRSTDKLIIGDCSDTFCESFQVLSSDRIVSCDSDDKVRLWRRNRASGSWEHREISDLGATCFEAFPGGRIILGVTWGGVLLLQEDGAGRMRHQAVPCELQEPVIALQPQDDGSIIVLQESALSRIRHLAEGFYSSKTIARLEGMSCFDVSAEGDIFVGSRDGVITRVREAADGSITVEEVSYQAGPIHKVLALSGSPIRLVSALPSRIVVSTVEDGVHGPPWHIDRYLDGDVVTLQRLAGGAFFTFAGAVGTVWTEPTYRNFVPLEVLYYTAETSGPFGAYGRRLLVKQAQLLPDGRLAVGGASLHDSLWSTVQILGPGEPDMGVS